LELRRHRHKPSAIVIASTPTYDRQVAARGAEGQHQTARVSAGTLLPARVSSVLMVRDVVSSADFPVT